MSPRTGRPTDNPRKERLEIRLSQSERESLERLAIKLGLSLTNTILKALELLNKTEEYHETGQLLDAIVVKSMFLRKIQEPKPEFITDDDWNKRLKTYKEQLSKSDRQIVFNANEVAKLIAK